MNIKNLKLVVFVLATFLLILNLQIVTEAQEENTDDILAVSDRTTAVRDAIVAAVDGVTDAANVTNTHLAGITSLNLRNKSITALKSGDFDGMTGLTSLNLYGNQLSSLPNGIFEGLTALTTVRLGGNTTDPIQVGIYVEHIDGNNYKVVVPTGAPFAITVALEISEGVNPKGLGNQTVSKGSVESASFTAPSIVGTIVEIGGTLPLLPRNHYGYELAKIDPPSDEITENNTPEFTDGDTTTRSIAENAATATNIGTAIAATDADTDDTLTYTLGGTDATSFDIVSTSGQLQTKTALDYEAKNSYTVTVTVSDSNGGSDTITVTINVTDVTEDVVTETDDEEEEDEEENNAPSFNFPDLPSGHSGYAFTNSDDQPLDVLTGFGAPSLQSSADSQRPETTALLPNFPNPFNPETWIPYQLNKPSDVSITIYDIQGNVVRHLDLGQKQAGYYTDRSRAVHWDGRNAVGERVANGVYFYQLKVGDYSYLRKMLILK